MKTIDTILAPPPEPPQMQVSIAGVAELYAAAGELELSNPKALDGLNDMARVSVVTTAGAMRRLLTALAMMRGQP